MIAPMIDREEPQVPIGIVAKKFNISVHTLRLYEAEGLILPYRTETNRRYYSQTDIERISCIREMIKTHGLNLKGIKRLMSMVPCWDYRGGLDDDCLNCPVYYEAKDPCWTRDDVGPKCQLVDCRTCDVYRMEINCDKMKEVVFGHKLVNKK